MKKKIIFMIINMNVGGTEKALLNMVAEIPKENYEITILMLEKYGGFLDCIPPEVKVEYLDYYHYMKDKLNNPPHKSALHLLRVRELKQAFSILYFHLISKVCMDRSIFFKHILRNHPAIETEYDVAIAYAGPMDFISYFVINKVNSKKKYQWIHFDVSKIGFNKRFAINTYKKFDKIFTVSDQGNEKLCRLLPKLKPKIDTFKNVVSPRQIIQLANSGVSFNDDFDGLRILTVGRLSKEKGQDLAIRVMSRLKMEGHNVRWYCVGDGNAKSEYELLINEYGLEKDFILLGSSPNPYTYMKSADIYIQPSLHEGYCITLAEAKCFHKPIICTDFTGAREQIKNEITGIVVSHDAYSLYHAITRLVMDETLRYKFKRNLENESLKEETSINLNTLKINQP